MDFIIFKSKYKLFSEKRVGHLLEQGHLIRQLDICVQRTWMPLPGALIKVLALSDNYRSIKADLYNIEENCSSCRTIMVIISGVPIIRIFYGIPNLYLHFSSCYLKLLTPQAIFSFFLL